MSARARFAQGWWLLGLAAFYASSLALAGYKARPWTIRLAEQYPARLTSEGVTVAIEPLYQDALAAQFFDKNDIVTRGIMPIGVLIFNDNDFPVLVEGLSAELVCGDDRIRTLFPNEVVHRLFSKEKKNVWLPQPIPRISRGDQNAAAFEDFDHKFLDKKVVAAHQKGGGFLYLRIPESKDIQGYLAKSRIYIPQVIRYDTGRNMIFFEIELQPAVAAPARN